MPSDPAGAPRHPAQAPNAPPAAANAPPVAAVERIGQNIEAILEFHAREAQKISRSQRLLERVSGLIGQPVFVGLVLLFVALWMGANIALIRFGMAEFDPPPFHWLQGILGLGALLTTIVVLGKQNRLGGVEAQRAHLDLKVNLMTEQKVAKLIDLIEELRRDLPNVKKRHDPEAVALQQSMDPAQVQAALDERGAADETPAPAVETAGAAPGTP